MFIRLSFVNISILWLSRHQIVIPIPFLRIQHWINFVRIPWNPYGMRNQFSNHPNLWVLLEFVLNRKTLSLSSFHFKFIFTPRKTFTTIIYLLLITANDPLTWPKDERQISALAEHENWNWNRIEFLSRHSWGTNSSFTTNLYLHSS